MTADEMVGWHHRLNGHKFEQTWGGRDGEGMLACCNPRVHKESTHWKRPQCQEGLKAGGEGDDRG